MALTVSGTLKRYWMEHASLKPVAKARIDYAIRDLDDFFGERPLQEIRLPACREYQAHRLSEGVCDGTIRRELTVLKAAANHCYRWDYITDKELPRIELPPDSRPRAVWLYKDELKSLAGTATGRALWFILLAYYTAGRKASIEKLERYQVDLTARRINLSKRKQVQTKKRRPIVPIDPAVYDRVVELLGSHDSKFVLASEDDIRWEFTKAADKAGLLMLPERGLREEGRLTPHVLRHSRATHLLQDGVNPFAVANLLGDNVQTVLRVYGHACPDYLAETITGRAA